MRFKSFKIGKIGEKSDEETVQEETVSLTEVADMEEQMASKTQKLKDAEKQLKGLTDFTKVSEEDEDEIPGPHGPLIELTLEPGNDLTDPETEVELNTLPSNENEDSEQDIKIVKLDNKDTVKVADKTDNESADKDKKNEKSEQGEDTKPDEKTEPAKAPLDINDGFSNLFSNEEEEVNPLANLISSLPEVSAEELINELEEIKNIIQEKQQG